ncbi:MAG: tRNA guanosine(34) transglycosylase Tgt [Gemmatimonadota bacterium]
MTTFRLLARDPAGAARAGELLTPRGRVATPAFMPVGTQATVKGVTPAELREVGVEIVLANAYHLYLRPGAETVAEAGGLHRFMGWDGPVLTDSGGYQVFSLSALARVDDEGVTFRSHLDGSLHRFTPEKVVEIQRDLGSDVAMPLDHCLANPAGECEAREAVERTLRWLERSVRHAEALRARGGAGGALFGIVQGSTFAGLRRDSARATRAFDLPGTAIGGLAVGEPNAEMRGVLEALEPELDPRRPRYVMGVGFPEDLVHAVARGMDLFDCVAPTRHGRNGTLFTRDGRINIRGRAHRRDHGPIEPGCGCGACALASRAYLSHLFHAREVLGLRLATLHNLHFLTTLLREAREAVLASRYASWADDTLARYAAGGRRSGAAVSQAPPG